ncbi:MAG: tetratricopeptide repeat protein [Proteobacteria bacterium]|nr:tetratricopeptide repeat protein [Pseudomonadota bacterium]
MARAHSPLLIVLTFCISTFFPALPLSAADNLLEKITHTVTNKSQSSISITSQVRPDYEVVENLKRQVLILKMRGTNLGKIPTLQTYQDSVVLGYQITSISKDEYWVKIKTSIPNLKFRVVVPKFQPNVLNVLFYTPEKKEPLLDGIEITNILRELNPTNEILYIFSKKPLQHDLVRDKSRPGKIMKIRLYNARLSKGLIVPGAQTDMLKSIKLEEQGKYINLAITPRTHALKISKRVERDPVRLIFTISENKNVLVTDPDEELIQEKKKVAEKKLEIEKRDKFLTRLFTDAEKFYKIGRFNQASLKFKNIYNFAPDSEIGVRSAFRAADSLFQQQRRKPVKGNEHFVNQEYKSAISAALIADVGYEDIPRAYYNIGRNHLNLKFYEDAFNQFEILVQNYPESPYAKNALFHQGVIHLNMERYSKSVELLDKFVEENTSSPLIHAAYYKIGEAQFQLKRYKDAKTSFEKAWSLDAEYMKKDPELMFHMGEAYFENQEYNTARAIYEELIDLYPREPFSNLVAIRIGDFLREEEKYEDAIKAYEKAINRFPNELLLIGKMRIANILSERPNSEDYKKALDIYNFIITKHVLSDQLEEATLRRALTLSLFNHYADAITSLETFCERFPENVYVKNEIIHDRILETIKAYISDFYFQGKHLDALGVYEKYEKQYFLRSELSACFHPIPGERRRETVARLSKKAPLFLISDSYYRLGLYDKALAINKHILSDEKDPIAPIVLFNQGKIFDAKDEYAKAQEEYGTFITLYREHIYTPLVKKALGDSYFKIHKPDRITRAIRIYRQTIRDYQDSDNMLEREIVPECWFALGNLYQGIGQYDDSIDAYKNVLNFYEHPLQSKNVDEYVMDTHFILGNLYLELNQLPEALETYNNAIRLFPDSDKTPWAKYYKGEIFVKNNQKDEALKIFEELIEDAKKTPEALWGPLATESHRTILNDLQFDRYLNRTPTAANTE